jgi:transcriptional regulator with XRE-family HTH domain
MSQQKKLELPARLREFRGRAKWSQQELADRLGVSGNYISMIELGKKLPGPSLLKLFESLERAPMDALAGAEGAADASFSLSLLSTEALIRNFLEVAESLPLGGVPEKKRVVGGLRELLDEIERRLLASSGALSEAQRIAVQAARPGGRPGTK